MALAISYSLLQYEQSMVKYCTCNGDIGMTEAALRLGSGVEPDMVFAYRRSPFRRRAAYHLPASTIVTSPHKLSQMCL